MKVFGMMSAQFSDNLSDEMSRKNPLKLLLKGLSPPITPFLKGQINQSELSEDNRGALCIMIAVDRARMGVYKAMRAR